jgi:hypothetical protein
MESKTWDRHGSQKYTVSKVGLECGCDKVRLEVVRHVHGYCLCLRQKCGVKKETRVPKKDAKFVGYESNFRNRILLIN